LCRQYKHWSLAAIINFYTTSIKIKLLSNQNNKNDFLDLINKTQLLIPFKQNDYYAYKITPYINAEKKPDPDKMIFEIVSIAEGCCKLPEALW
jgi:hypothetical protein